MANKAGPRGKYVIHSAHTNLPKPTNSTTFVSIDPGCSNFAIRIETRNLGGTKVKLLAMSKHIIEYSRIKSGLGSVSNYVFNIIKVLELYTEFYTQTQIVCIEDQMYVNGSMSGLKENIINYFIYCWPNICVCSISALLKTSMIFTTGLSKTAKQQAEVVYAFELCELRNDNASLDILMKYNLSKTPTDKVHDLCVTINQLVGFCNATGY